MFGYAKDSVFGYRGAPAVIVPTSLLEDTFTGADATSLDAHAPDVDSVGGGWLQAGTNFEISGNRARFTSAVTDRGTYLDVGASHVDFSFDFERVAGDYHGAYFAAAAGTAGAPPANCWQVEHTNGVAWTLVERTAGANANRGSSGAAGSAFHVRVVATAGNVKVYVGGALVIDYSASITYPGTHIGLKGGVVGAAYWDNLNVQAS